MTEKAAGSRLAMTRGVGGASPSVAGRVGVNEGWSQAVPPQVYFLVSAVFHYLGPAFAVLLFAALAPLGVAWLRIVSAAVVFAAWRRPWRLRVLRC